MVDLAENRTYEEEEKFEKQIYRRVIKRYILKREETSKLIEGYRGNDISIGGLDINSKTYNLLQIQNYRKRQRQRKRQKKG